MIAMLLLRLITFVYHLSLSWLIYAVCDRIIFFKNAKSESIQSLILSLSILAYKIEIERRNVYSSCFLDDD